MDLLWTDFLNSEWHDWRGSGRSEDRLEKPAWLSEFIKTWNLTAPIPPRSEEIAYLKEFRVSLRHMAEGFSAGALVSLENLEKLNEFMAFGQVIRKILQTGDDYMVDIVPVRQDWYYIISEIAVSFARTIVEGEGMRIRTCANPDCLWIFYDSTRNRSKRFCSDKMCGNLMKVRRFRKHKQDSCSKS